MHRGVPMASSQEYLDFILKQLQGLGQEISFRKMRWGIFALLSNIRRIYDNRLLLASSACSDPSYIQSMNSLSRCKANAS